MSRSIPKMGASMILLLVVVGHLSFSDQIAASGPNNHQLPNQEGVGDEDERQMPWKCCDNCVCPSSDPLRCGCQDWLSGSCHPNCRKCVKLPLMIYPPYVRCADIILGHCGEPCSTQDQPLNN
ncbi:Bowman-Birk type proteinase inhibitor D-II-like isoform X1 [Ananas comosus]|uniref:Bowman-Birk type proteinase inhibitor D-II-like isoform X1 n=1 Tax=Ananas comosus TaxID=4615 RepID=A0A6P5GH84_ANACO|nr:Bowman-Birk type proteinase inhibitor D-II-like isoform X1 [Ananas comosus]